MIPEYVLGMTLAQAQALLRPLGITPTVVETKAPPRRNASAEELAARNAGTLRVIRVRGDELVVSAFLDGMPEGAAPHNV